MQRVSITKNISILEELFDVLNKQFFNSVLEKPVITLNPGSTNRNKGTTVTLGWCTTKKIWIDKEKNMSYYEITICPEFIDRGIEEICATLLHEMTHLYNLYNGVKDVSRSGYYHNKNFKREAECHGLVIEFVKTIGWSKTSLNNYAKAFCNNLDIKLEKFVRQAPYFLDDKKQDDDNKNEKKRSIKYVCPECGISVRATKVVRIKCEDCNESMIDSDEIE